MCIVRAFYYCNLLGDHRFLLGCNLGLCLFLRNLLGVHGVGDCLKDVLAAVYGRLCQLDTLVDSQERDNILGDITDFLLILREELRRAGQATDEFWKYTLCHRSQSRDEGQLHLRGLHLHDLHLLIEFMHLFGVESNALHLRGRLGRLGVLVECLGQCHSLDAKCIHQEYLFLAVLLRLFISRREIF